MATRIITGVLDYPNGDPWVGARVRFSMVSGSYTVSPAVTYPQTSAVAITDDTGAFSTTLTSGLGIWWDCVLPDGDGFRFALNDGSAVTLEQLRAEATGAPVPISYPTNAITITSPAQGQMLAHNGTQFVNRRTGEINVLDYAAAGDGLTDDTTALQDAIDACTAAGGGTVFLPAGQYRITATLVIGDGDEAVGPSTINGVALRGAGIGPLDNEIAAAAAVGITTLIWDGAAGDPMLLLEGPIMACAVEDIFFQGWDGSGNMAGGAIRANHPAHCAFRRLRAQSFSGTIYHHHSYPSPANYLGGANQNHWDQVGCGGINNGPSVIGFQIGGTTYGSSPHLDAAGNLFQGCFANFYTGSTYPNQTGWKLNFADGNTYLNCFGWGGAVGGGLKFGAVSGTTSYPEDNVFIRGQFYPGVTGTDPATHQANYFIGITTGDGAAVPTQTSAAGFTSLGDWFGSTWWNMAVQTLATTGVLQTADGVFWTGSQSGIGYPAGNYWAWSQTAGGDAVLHNNAFNPRIQVGRTTGDVYTSGSFKSEFYLALKDGVGAGSVMAGYAKIYVDVADGDLKVMFSDGTIKTIVVDT